MRFRSELITEKHWYFLLSILLFLNVTLFGCFILVLTKKVCIGC